MISELGSALPPVTGLVQGSPAPVISKVQDAGGNNLPPPQQVTVAQAAAQKAAASAQTAGPANLESMVALLNKFLNDSGQPYQYRIAPLTDNKLIQEINPANGAVLGEFSASEFPALALAAGVSGLLFNSHA